MMEELGRVPTSIEFRKKYGSILNSIAKGRYHSEISNWNEYLVHRGLAIKMEPGGWTQEAIDGAFDEMKKALGRTPISREFIDSYGGAFGAIVQRRYDPDISTWNGYLEHRGEKPRNKRVNGLDILEDLLEEEDE